MANLINSLTEYGRSDFYPYHMPGHKRQPQPEFPECFVQTDITEIHGFDNLHQPEGILLEAQKRAAEAYGAEESFYLINGSTCGILSAISAAVPFGGHLLIARNCHKSVYHAAYLRKLRLSYIYPKENPYFQICEAITPKQVEEALAQYKDVSGVLIVSPTYEGRIADIREIARIVHAQGLPLIVDEAHGAHLGFAEEFAVNSARLGADLVINSVHKTLPAMTQTALLHVSGNRINRDMLRRFLHIYQTSSPSYVLMASIEQAVETAAEDPYRFTEFAQRWQGMLARLRQLKYIRVLPELGESEDVHDIGKLVIYTKEAGITGSQMSHILRQKYHLEMEMACESYVLAMFTVADGEEAYRRLSDALQELDEIAARRSEACEAACEKTGAILTAYLNKEGSMESEIFPGGKSDSGAGEMERATIPFWQAWDMPTEKISLEAAQGRLAGEFINLYPPGTPVVVPGEVLKPELLQQIMGYLDSGLEVQGISADRQVRVICMSV